MRYGGQPNERGGMRTDNNAAWRDLTFEIEQFYYAEADLLDSRRFEDWLTLLADDLVYYMPTRHNVKFGEHAARENTPAGEGISWFDEDKWTLTKRVEQIMTGVHWAEEPLSRTTHMITNVRVTDAQPAAAVAKTVTVASAFLVYLNRLESETMTFAGRRTDHLRRTDTDHGWQIARREILLDQNVLQMKNITTFF